MALAAIMESESECDAEQLFLRELDTIERAIRFTCQRHRMAPDEVEDFGSHVKLKLIEENYAVVRKYDGRSTFAGFIGVVVHRLLLDYRISQWGKWHASTQARSLGEEAIAIEAMVMRDGRSIDEIEHAIQRRWPGMHRKKIEEVVNSLPHRNRRPRAVEIDLAAAIVGATAESVDGAAFASRHLALSRRIAETVQRVVAELKAEDQVLFRLRFERQLTVAEISRTLRLDQKPLYRRLQRLLHALRRRLERSGITATDVVEVLNGSNEYLDFGFDTTAQPQEFREDEESK